MIHRVHLTFYATHLAWMSSLRSTFRISGLRSNMTPEQAKHGKPGLQLDKNLLDYRGSWSEPLSEKSKNVESGVPTVVARQVKFEFVLDGR